MTPRGYAVPKAFQQYVAESSRTSVWVTVAVAIADHASIILLCLLAYLLATKLSVLYAIFFTPILWLFVGRSMRGLECLVHEASHYNWSRNKQMNDILADLFAAWPVLSSVTNFRSTHLIHHSHLGGPGDTGRVRFLELRLSELDRSSFIKVSIGLLGRLGLYVPRWWWAILADRLVVLRFILWHLVVFIGPIALLYGWAYSLGFWLYSWGIPVFCVLPCLRLIGEQSEHDYDAGISTVFNSTYSHTGLVNVLFFHPHNDGYHLLHHLYPSIPHFRLKRVHKALAVEDPTNWQAIQLEQKYLDVGRASTHALRPHR